MNKENMGSYLWIIVTTTIMLCLMAFASPFGVYVKNSLEQFAGDFIEKEGEHNVPETERCELKIVYNTADSGQVIDAASVTLKKYEQYSIPSPQIPGYVPNIKTVEGTIYEDTTIYVDYTRGNYSITYITNNGTFNTTLLNAEGKLKTSYTNYQYGDHVTLLDGGDVTRGSMNFLGWYDNEAFAGSPITEIKPNEYGNKVYYAKWSAVDYTITYVLNDANGQYYYVRNENAAGSIAGFDSVITDSNGNLKPEYTTYTYGTQLKLPTTVHKFGYTFLGWSEEPDGSMVKGNYRTQITETDSGNKVFYAHWKRNTYTITYHTGFIRPTGEKVYYEIKDAQYTVIDSSGRSKTYEGFPTSYTYGDTIVLPTKLVLNGYDKSVITEIAWFNKQTEKITITSGGDNAGTVNGYPTDAVNKTTISPATIGFVLGDHSAHAYDHTDLDLYIKPIPDKFTVVFHSNVEPDAFTRPNVENYNQGFLYDEVKNLTANKFTMLGRTFLDWNSKADGSGVTFKDKENVTNMTDIIAPNSNMEIILYAQWRMNNYNIKYDLNRGEGTTVPQFTAGGSYPTRATFDTAFYVTAPVREGYTFRGWKVISGLYPDTARYGSTSKPATPILPTTICDNGSHTGNIYFVNLTPYDEATVVLQAQWERNGDPGNMFKPFSCTIKYDLNRGDSSTTPKHGAHAPLTYVFDENIEISNPTMEGYTFTGWTITDMDPDLTHYYGSSAFVVTQNAVTTNGTVALNGVTGDTIQLTKATNFINLRRKGTVNFKANWKPNTYTIQYDLNQGNGTTTPSHGSSHPTTATFDTPFTVSNPSRVGYTFSGWNISGMDSTTHYYGSNTTTNTTISGTKVTEFKNLRCTAGTVKFTATWTPNTYTIAYDLNKGNGSSTPSHGSSHPTSATFDANVMISNPSRVGYSFSGWTITGMDTTVTHYYGSSAYSLSGNAVSPSTTATTSTSISSTKATNFINLRASSGTVTFKANWTNNVYKITLDKQGGSGGTSTIYEKYDVGFFKEQSCTTAITTISAPSKVGYIYDGYWDSASKGGANCINGTTIVMADNKFSADATIYAGYTARTYSISYDLNKGKGSTTPSHGSSHPTTATYDVSFTVSHPSRPHYSFDGWMIENMSNDCTHYYGSSSTTSTSITKTTATSFKNLHSGGGTVNFIAIWTPNVYTITLNKNGGSGGSDAYYEKYDVANFKELSCSTQITSITIPSRTGYTFAGYYTATSGGTQYVNASGTILSTYTTFTDNTTLYAHWTPNNYNIQYDLVGGSHGSSHPSSATFDETFTVSAPSKEDYDFKGWNITGMDSCTHYYGSSSTTNTSLTKITATSFKNLRSTSGTVTFTANWEISHMHNYTSVSYATGCTQTGKTVYTCQNNDGRCDTPSYEAGVEAALGHLSAPKGICGTHHHDAACSDTSVGGELNVEHSNSSWQNDHGSHAQCSHGSWNHEGSVHRYCGRQNPAGGSDHNRAYGSTYYCGYQVSYAWCWQHNGHKNGSVTFNCGGGSVKATGVSVSHPNCRGWECSPWKYTVTFNANGGSGGPGAKESGECYNNSIAKIYVSNPTKSGWNFAGWYTSASGGTYVTSIAGDKDMSAYDGDTLYAHWTCNGHTYVNKGTASLHQECSKCGNQLTSHSYTVDSGVQYSAAKCGVNRKNYKRCSCGYNPKSSSYVIEVAGTALSHNIVNDAAVAATCTKAGKTAGTHCSRSGCTYKTGGTTVAATGHTPKKSWGSVSYSYSYYTSSSCKKYATCSTCRAQCDISYPAHSWNNGKVTDPTCQAQGYTTYTCKNCDGTKKSNYTAKVACKKGFLSSKCKWCGKKL